VNGIECRSFELETFTQLCKISECNSIFRAQRNAERQASQSCYTSSQRRACGRHDQHQKRKDLDNSIKHMVRCRPNVIDVEWYFEYITKLKSLAKTGLMIGFVHYFVCNRSSSSGRIQHKFKRKRSFLLVCLCLSRDILKSMCRPQISFCLRLRYIQHPFTYI
jgi:hypothetical protein